MKEPNEKAPTRVLSRPSFKKVRFVASSPSPKTTPKGMYSDTGKGPLPEVALVGRSNVGKSTLINHLCIRKKLARTSATPGKTRELVFFVIDELFSLVDLPGYGFAAKSKKDIGNFGEVANHYLSERKALQLVIVLLDCRHLPKDTDLQLLDFLIENERPFALVLTKFDKLKQKEQKPQKVKIKAYLEEQLDYEMPEPIAYSALKNKGRDALISQISQHLSP